MMNKGLQIPPFKGVISYGYVAGYVPCGTKNKDMLCVVLAKGNMTRPDAYEIQYWESGANRTFPYFRYHIANINNGNIVDRVLKTHRTPRLIENMRKYESELLKIYNLDLVLSS